MRNRNKTNQKQNPWEQILYIMCICLKCKSCAIQILLKNLKSIAFLQGNAALHKSLNSINDRCEGKFFHLYFHA